MWRRWTILIFLTAIILGHKVALAAMADPQINGDQTGIVIDAESKVVYWQKNGDQKAYPASTTKVLTALVVLENCDLDEIVQVSDNAIDSIIGSTLWLEYGEKKTVEDLLHGLLMVSANDAAVALAEHVSGSVEAFSEKMNEKALSLGATHSHFVNPHGLHEAQHYSTARDMAIIFSAAMNNPDFIRIANTQSYAMSWHGKTEDRVIYHATLQALPYPWVIANKNGYTDEAGQTLVYGAEKGETRFVAVLMGCSDIWNEMDRLLIAVRDSLESTILIERNSILSFGEQTWKISDDVEIAHIGSTKVGENLLIRLEPEQKQISLLKDEVVLSRGDSLLEEDQVIPWYLQDYINWLPLLVIPFWWLYFITFYRVRARRKSRKGERP